MIQVSYNYDPAVHSIRLTGAGEWLRRVTKRKELITYYHRVFKTWVVSLRGDNRLLDIGQLGTGRGEGSWSTHANLVSIVCTLKSLLAKAEIRKRLKQQRQRELLQGEETRRMDDDVLRAGYSWVKKRKGAVKAERILDKLPGMRLAVSGY